MPKGGDLPQSRSGAVYAENLDSAAGPKIICAWMLRKMAFSKQQTASESGAERTRMLEGKFGGKLLI